MMLDLVIACLTSSILLVWNRHGTLVQTLWADLDGQMEGEVGQAVQHRTSSL